MSKKKHTWSRASVNPDFAYWDDNCESLLIAAARRYRQRTNDFDNFVEPGDLISEGWLRQIRFCKSAEQRSNMFHNLMRSMRIANRALRNEHYLSKYQPSVSRMSCVKDDEDDIRGWVVGDEFIENVDCLDALLSACENERDLAIIKGRLEGLTFNEVGKRVMLSGTQAHNLACRVWGRFQQSWHGCDREDSDNIR